MIDWSKPIEYCGKHGLRENAEVLKVLQDGNAVIYWTMGDDEFHEVYGPSMTHLWRNVPELSKRDRFMLWEMAAHLRPDESTGSVGKWLDDNAARLAREAPDE